MSQKRLIHLMLLHVHKDRTLQMPDVARDLVEPSEYRSLGSSKLVTLPVVLHLYGQGFGFFADVIFKRKDQ